MTVLSYFRRMVRIVGSYPQPTNPEQHRAFLEGQRAFEDGIPQRNCPYADRDQARWWRRGRDKALQESDGAQW